MKYLLTGQEMTGADRYIRFPAVQWVSVYVIHDARVIIRKSHEETVEP